MGGRAPVLIVLDNSLEDPQPALLKGASLARPLNAPLCLYLNCWHSAMVRSIGFDTPRLEGAIRSVMRAWERRLGSLLDDLGAGDAEVHLIWEPGDFPFLSKLILEQKPRLILVHAEQTPAIRRLFVTPRQWKLLRKAPPPVLCVGDEPWPDHPTVLAAVDVDESDDPLTGAVIREARHLADSLGGALTLVHVVEFPDEALLTFAESDLAVTLPDQSEIVAARREALQALARRHGIAPENTRVLEGNPARALAHELESRPGIVVMGTVYRGAVKRLLLGSTAERILRHGAQDIMVVKPDDFVSPWQDDDVSSGS